MSDQEMTDCESQGLKPRLYGYGYNDSSNKYNKLKIVSVATVCLLLGLIAGGYVQQIASSIGSYGGAYPYPAGGAQPYQPPPYEANNFGAAAPGERARRPNEDECAARRCCRIKDGLFQKDLPKGLNCRQLNDESCGGDYDEYCDWDCDPPANERAAAGKRGRKRRFRGISAQNGVFTLPKAAQDPPGHDRYEDCMQEGKVITGDDCGVEYDEELDPDELDFFCKNRPTHSNKPDGPPDVEHDVERRRLDVIGSDDRNQVSSTSFPYSGVLYLNFDKPTGGTYRCTATMISPRWAITAAHCVYGGGAWYSGWKFYKNAVSGCPSSGGYDWSTAVVFTAWQSTEPWDWDIAWIQLSSDPSVGGYFDVGYDDSLAPPHSFNIISHPADKADCTKWYQYCPYDGPFSEHLLVTHECDTSGGASGSGVYIYWSATLKREIVAIHTRGDCYDDVGYHSVNYCNTAVRITSGKYNAIKSYVTDNPNLE